MWRYSYHSCVKLQIRPTMAWNLQIASTAARLALTAFTERQRLWIDLAARSSRSA